MQSSAEEISIKWSRYEISLTGSKVGHLHVSGGTDRLKARGKFFPFLFLIKLGVFPHASAILIDFIFFISSLFAHATCGEVINNVNNEDI